MIFISNWTLLRAHVKDFPISVFKFELWEFVVRWWLRGYRVFRMVASHQEGARFGPTGWMALLEFLVLLVLGFPPTIHRHAFRFNGDSQSLYVALWLTGDQGIPRLSTSIIWDQLQLPWCYFLYILPLKMIIFDIGNNDWVILVIVSCGFDQ